MWVSFCCELPFMMLVTRKGGNTHVTSPYLETHYLIPGELIINDYPEMIHSGDVYEGYIPATQE